MPDIDLQQESTDLEIRAKCGSCNPGFLSIAGFSRARTEPLEDTAEASDKAGWPLCSAGSTSEQM